MSGVSFPQEARRIAQLGASVSRALNQKNLSLKECEELDRQIMDETTDKMKDVAIPLLMQVEEKKQTLVERQMVRLSKAETPLAKLNLLIPIIAYLEPEEVDRQLEAIQVDASLADPRIQNVMKSKLERVLFAQKKPLVRDLEAFGERIRKIAAVVRRTNSLNPMEALNTIQCRQIQAAGRVQ